MTATIQHGRYHSYTAGGCRCPLCKQAAARYNKARTVRIHQGTWKPFTDAEPVRRHVATLRAAGCSWQTLAALSGVADTTIHVLMTEGRPTVRTKVAEKILAVTPALDDLPGWGKVDAAGSRRRIQALGAAGWSLQVIATQLDVDRSMLRKLMTRPTVRVFNARAIRDLYDRMWDKFPPNETRYERTVVSRTKGLAQRSGWLPALAWDDDLIDIPDAELDAELARRAAAMDDDEVRICNNARYHLGDTSPLTVAASREYKRRLLRPRTVVA